MHVGYDLWNFIQGILDDRWRPEYAFKAVKF
jgi:hypothetical protein